MVTVQGLPRTGGGTLAADLYLSPAATEQRSFVTTFTLVLPLIDPFRVSLSPVVWVPVEMNFIETGWTSASAVVKV